jgi:gas vesicle protein
VANNTGSFVWGFFIGALAGATAALLMAPASGEETMQQIQLKGNELKGQVQTQAERLAEEAKVRSQQVSDTVREQINQVQGKVTQSGEQNGAATPSI